ncbi:MAG: hypothetical protein IJO26_00780 [Clostridium sp.]|nr:hypothetical protein [Clostridium sp.]
MNIQLKGSCVTREALNYWKLVFPDEEDIKVDYYMFQKPIAVLASKKIETNEETLKKIEDKLIASKSVRDFVVKQLRASFDKTIIKENFKLNYYLIDFIDERMQLINYKDSFIEYREEIWDILKNDSNKVENDINIFKKYIDLFISRIKQFCPEERIILHKAYAIYLSNIDDKEYYLTDTFNYSNPNYKLNTLQGAIKRNNILLEIYKYMEEKYPNIKYIELPYENYYSPVDHRYGRGYYHYNEKYYIDFILKLKEIHDGKYKYVDVKKISNNNYNKLKELSNIISFNDVSLSYIEDIQKKINYQIDRLKLNLNDFNYKDNEVIYRDDNGKIIAKNIYKKGLLRIQKNYLKSNNFIINIFNDYGNIVESRYISEKKLNRIDYFDDRSYLIRCKFFENGKVIRDLIYSEYIKLGKVTSMAEYDLSGRKKIFAMYYGNGKVRSKTYYKDNNIYDRTEVFDNCGQLKEVRFYYPNKIQKENIQYGNGIKKKTIYYFSNGKTKKIVTYDNKGNIKSSISRKNDRESFLEETI